MGTSEYRNTRAALVSFMILSFGTTLSSCGGSNDDGPGFSCGEEISLQNDIMPIIESDCSVPLCHLNGSNPILSSKEAVIANAAGIRSQVETLQMPPGGEEPLSVEEIELIGCWAADGAEDN